MKGCFLTAVLLSVTAGLAAQNFSIARYRGDRKAAVSFTFDDGYMDQYTLAVSELEKRGWKGTFWIVPARVESWDVKPLMKWSHIKDLSERGHEISNHGMTHARMTKLTREAVYHEIHDADTAIASHIGRFPRTYCYAYSDYNPEIKCMAAEGRVGTREYQTAFGGGSATESLSAGLDHEISTGGWLVTVTHAMLDGYDQFERMEDYTAFLDIVKGHESELWIDTFENVADYQAVMNATDINVEKKGPGRFVIKPSCCLDSGLYKSTLTLCIDTERAPRKAVQGQSALTPVKAGGRWTVEIDPFKGPVTLRFLKH